VRRAARTWPSVESTSQNGSLAIVIARIRLRPPPGRPAEPAGPAVAKTGAGASPDASAAPPGLGSRPWRPANPAYRRLAVDERRRRLLDLGARLFSRHSYAELSMSAIAREAGISKALLYHYFPGKQAYFVATLQQQAEELEARTATDPSQPPAEQLRRALDAFLAWVEENAEGLREAARGGEPARGRARAGRPGARRHRRPDHGRPLAGRDARAGAARGREGRGCGSWTARSATGSRTATSTASSCSARSTGA
jgi:AcrR family transcriptional regulator